MSIRELVDDAHFLRTNGRYLGALTVLMLAVAASARKTFPQTRTTKKGETEFVVKDKQAFIKFLRNRLNSVFASGGHDDYDSPSILGTTFENREIEIEEVLYTYYRCNLIHEARLPENIEFVAPYSGQTGVSLTFSCAGDKITFDYGLIDALIRVVVDARCNGNEFGIKHYDLQPAAGLDEEDFFAELCAKYKAPASRVSLIKDVYIKMAIPPMSFSSDRELKERLLSLVQSGQVSGGDLTGLRRTGFSDEWGNLHPSGLSMLRELARAYQLVEVG